MHGPDPRSLVATRRQLDNCSGYVSITFNGTTNTPGDCPQEYVLTRQWTATDECGNTATATLTITIQDTHAPVFTYVPPNITVDCNNIPAPGSPTATDNCDALDRYYLRWTNSIAWKL